MIIINPGSGPVSEKSTIDNAYKNMEVLLEEAGLPPKYARNVEAEEGDGRFEFVVPGKNGEVSVSMPGVPLDVLKGSLLRAPRLYVDGSSWWWRFAVGQVRDHVLGEEEDPSPSEGDPNA